MMKAAPLTLCLALFASAIMPLGAQQTVSPADAAKLAANEAVRRQEATIQMRKFLGQAEANKAKAGNDLRGLTNAAQFYKNAADLFPKVEVGNEAVQADMRLVRAGHSTVCLRLARACSERGDFLGARSYLTIALNVDPSNETLQAVKLEYDVQDQYAKGQRPDPAVVEAGKTNAEHNIAVETMVQNGKFLYESGQFPQAKEVLKQAKQLDRNNTAANYYYRLATQAEYEADGRQRESDNIEQISKVSKGWLLDHSGEDFPTPNPLMFTNLIYTGKGRQAISRKLDQIKVEKVEYDLPLSEVLKDLTTQALNRDPEGQGINFIYTGRVDTNDTSISTLSMMSLSMAGGGMGMGGGMGGGMGMGSTLR